MNYEEYDRKVYDLAYEFLLTIKKVDKELIDKHIKQTNWDVLIANGDTANLDKVFHFLMSSLKNRSMYSGVIGGSKEENINKLKNLLPTLASMNKYEDSNALLIDIFDELNLDNIQETLNNKRAIWNQYAKSLFSAKAFLMQFKDYDDFMDWVDYFDEDDRTRPALPLLLSERIFGLGFALSCDFLKELGRTKFGKPDIHVKDIFGELKLSKDKENDFLVLEDIIRISENKIAENKVENKDVTPYAVDKLFWLIGSGKFYRSGINIHRQKANFIKYVKEKIPEYF